MKKNIKAVKTAKAEKAAKVKTAKVARLYKQFGKIDWDAYSKGQGHRTICSLSGGECGVAAKAAAHIGKTEIFWDCEDDGVALMTGTLGTETAGTGGKERETLTSGKFKLYLDSIKERELYRGNFAGVKALVERMSDNAGVMADGRVFTHSIGFGKTRGIALLKTGALVRLEDNGSKKAAAVAAHYSGGKGAAAEGDDDGD